VKQKNAEADFSMIMCLIQYLHGGGKYFVLLDTSAQVSVFTNDSLLANITTVDEPVLISGIKASSKFIKCNRTGTLPGLQDINIMISPSAKRNILSFASINPFFGTKWRTPFS
jgi:hypothetical protein